MKRRLLLILFVFLPVLLNAGWKRKVLLPGTSWKSYFYVYQAAKSGPTILLVAPHANERSAGLFLLQLVRKYRINRGRLIVFPAPVMPAWRTYSRYKIEDLNRQFGPHTDSNNTPVDLVSAMIKGVLQHNKIDFIFNIHEGLTLFRKSWYDFGQSIVIDHPSLVPLCNRAVARINRRIKRAYRFLVAYKPMANTLTYFAFDKGIKAIGVEVSMSIRSIRRRMLYQKIVIEEFLKQLKVKLVRVRR